MFNKWGNKSNFEDEKVLAYDLRQGYAKLVEYHMKDIADKRKEQSFYDWFMALQDLHTMIRFKFRNPKKDEEEYKKIIKDIKKLAGEYSAVWKGDKNPDVEGIAKIDYALRVLEEFLYNKMNLADMFGSKYSDEEGL